jgi:multiple sugar transport system permease protein
MAKISISNETQNLTWQRMKRQAVPFAYLSPTLLLLAVLSFIPIATVVYYSLMNNVIITKDPPSFVGLDNYVKILSDKNFFNALGNTLFFAIASVIAHFVLGLLFAMLLNSKVVGPVTKSLFRVIDILPWVFTASIIAVLWRLLLYPNGVVNYFMLGAGFSTEPIEWLSSRQLALPTVTFINIWSGYPFYMVSFLAGLQGISEDLYEAGKIDGASGIQLFRFITLPQLKPVIISLAMLDFIWTTHQFTLIWMTTGGGPVRATEMLSTFTYKLAFTSYEFSLASTTAMLILALSLFVGVFYVRNQRSANE